MTPIEHDYRNQVQSHLEFLREAFGCELEQLITSGFFRSAVAILFEYDSPLFDQSFSVHVCAMSSVLRFEGDVHSFLGDTATAVPKGLYEERKYEEIETWAIASEIVKDWICEQWKRHGLPNTKIPVLVGHHDTFFKTNVVTKVRTTWQQIEQQINC